MNKVSSLTGMVQTDRGPPVSNYKEEPVDDPVSIWSIDSFLSSLSTAVVLERFPRFPLSSTLFSWFHSNIKRAFLILLEFSVTLSFFWYCPKYETRRVELYTRRRSACCTLQNTNYKASISTNSPWPRDDGLSRWQTKPPESLTHLAGLKV